MLLRLISSSSILSVRLPFTTCHGTMLMKRLNNQSVRSSSLFPIPLCISFLATESQRAGEHIARSPAKTLLSLSVRRAHCHWFILFEPDRRWTNQLRRLMLCWWYRRFSVRSTQVLKTSFWVIHLESLTKSFKRSNPWTFIIIAELNTIEYCDYNKGLLK